MKNTFSKFINLQGKYLTSLLFVLFFAVGQMWGAAELTLSTTASGAAFGDWNKTYTNVVITTVGPSSFASKKACGVSSNVSTNSLSSADSHYLDISLSSEAASSYTLEKVVLRVAGNNTGTTDYTAPLFYSNEATFDVNKVEGVMDIHYTGYDQSCDDNEYTFPAGTKSCRLYRRAKYTAPSGTTKGKVGAGSNYACSNQTMHITYMEVYLKSTAPSCDDANASIIADQSIYVNDDLDLEFTSDNVNTVSYSIKKGGSATSDASVTDGVFKATVAGTYVVTATQTADASSHCAVEESVTITVNAKTPVASVSITGDATAFIGMAKTLTANADQAVSEYKWEVDGVDQGVDAATFDFSASTAGTYSVVCKARNSFNDPGEYISSSAHQIVVTKLCGELIKATMSSSSNNDAEITGILTGTKDLNISSTNVTYDSKKGYKLGGNGQYLGITGLSSTLRAGDTAIIYVTQVSAKLQLFSDKGSTLIGEMNSGVVQGENKIILNASATGKSAIYLYRTSTAGSDMNPHVYSLAVKRSCVESTDCEMKSLTINSDEITPAEKVYSYVVAAASALTEVEVAYTIHPLASGSPASGFNVAVPAAGDPANTQTITVTAEDGTHSDTYTVSVTKAAAASNVVTLDALGVTGYTLSPAFAAATTEYSITKAYGTADPAAELVTYTKTEDAQTVEVVYSELNRNFTVTVTAEDNTTKEYYVINILQAEAPKSLSRVLFSNGFDAFIDNTNHTVKAYYLAGTSAPTATTITAGAGTAGEYAEGKITVTGADASSVDYIVTLEAVTPNTSTVAEDDPAGEFAGDEAWVKNGLLVYGNAAGYSAGDKWYVNRRLTKSGDAADDQRVIAGWVRSYFFVGNASKFIMTVGNNKKLKYSVDGGEAVAVEPTTLEIALSKGNHMIEIVSNQSSGDCRLSAPKLVELPPTFTVTYKAGAGTGDDVVDDDAAFVADCPNSFTAPEGKIFHSWKDGDDNDVAVGDPVTESMTLTAQWIGHYAVTFNLQGHGADIVAQDIVAGSKAVKPADPSEIGYDFGGWFTDAECTAGNEFDFNTAINAATELFAKWTAFDGCAVLVPVLSGDAPTAKNQAIDLQSGSFGGAIKTAGAKDNKWSESFAYTANGFGLQKGGADSLRVELNNDMKVGTVIKVKFYAAEASSRGLYLKNLSKTTKMEMTQTEVGAKEYTYTVEEGDGLAGTNAFLLSRNNTVYLQSVTVSNCGDAIVYHNLTSAVNIAGKGVVTLGATSVREGKSTTATYSDIDPLYEFVNWTVSGEGASIADASVNPATITMGTADAVVMLNLQLIPVKYTVNYYDGATAMGTEEVAVNENPTAAGIETAKRHYTFQGWSETDGGDVVALNTITRAEATTVNLYAVYAPVACPASGTIFSMEFDDDKRPSSTVKVAKNGGTLDLSEYAIISGGAAIIKNTESSDKDAISTDGKFKLTATKEVMKIELECVLQEGDIIRVPDNNAKYVISTSDSKTGTYQAQTSSQHEFAVTTDWAGVDDIYVLYDGSSLNFTEIEVYRPGRFDVSFDMMGHGSAIADIEDVLEGSKITAPTAPTDENYAFAGWYKENTLENEWDFANDVVNAATTLYAKWLDKSDATLKSLKYGSTDIELQANVYEYNVELSPLTAAVPALTAVANSPLATPAVDDADAFDGEGHATSTVTVTPAIGAAQVYTVNFSKASALPQVNVTEATTWNFAKTVAGSTSLENQTNVVLANVPGITNDATFNSQALLGTFNKLPGDYFQGSKLSFTTEVAGLLTITFRGTNNHARHMQVCIGNEETVVADWDYNSSSTSQTKSLLIPVGKVTLKAFEGEAAQNVRIYNMVLQTPDHHRTNLNPSHLGTLCWANNAVLWGGTLYELAGKDPNNYLVFDEVEDNIVEAGKPYIFMPEDGNTEIAVFNTDDAEPMTEAQLQPVNHMYGTFEGKTLTQEDDAEMYYFSGRNIWRVADFNVAIPIPAYRCYVDYPAVLAEEEPAAAPAPGRRRITMGTNGTNVATGVESIQTTEISIQKVLIDGKIYILRGEKMYDATGRLVK